MWIKVPYLSVPGGGGSTLQEVLEGLAGSVVFVVSSLCDGDLRPSSFLQVFHAPGLVSCLVSSSLVHYVPLQPLHHTGGLWPIVNPSLFTAHWVIVFFSPSLFHRGLWSLALFSHHPTSQRSFWSLSLVSHHYQKSLWSVDLLPDHLTRACGLYALFLMYLIRVFDLIVPCPPPLLS